MESTNNQIKHSTATDGKPPVVCSCLSEEFVEDFTSDGELTPIDIVAEITGLTYDEVRSCSKIVRVPQQLHTDYGYTQCRINCNNFKNIN